VFPCCSSLTWPETTWLIQTTWRYGLLNQSSVFLQKVHSALWTILHYLTPHKDYFNDTSVTIIYQRTIEHFLVELQDKGIRSTAHTVTTTTPSLKSPVRAPAQLLEDRDEDHDRLHRSNFTRLAENVISLEKKIAAASLSLDVLHLDPLTTYNPISIDNLTATFPAVDFHDYFAASALQNVPQWLIVTSPAYISSLQKIIKEEKQDVLEAYLVSRAAFTFAPYLGRKTNVWRAYRSLDAFLRGTKFTVVEDRAQYCVGDVESALGFAIGRYFSNITFGEDAQRESTKIIAGASL
jgi:endothelin-converting enzyme